ncbi:MAG: hypothetical protein IT446_12965 [Phycisphaerales bacterium]|nr:hypothetical protein [Phycisphaerales bacterium]
MRFICLAGAALLMSASLVLGDTQEVLFPNFSDTTGLQLNGSAAVVNTSDGAVLRVVPATYSQAGSFFSTNKLQATAFSTFFSFRMTNPGGTLFDGPDNTVPGADGLVFVVQPNSSGAGSVGQGIGYQGIANSVGVEFDTWQNVYNNDPSSNHVGIDLDGVVDHGAGSPFTLDVSPDFDNGNIWYAWVDYDGSVISLRASESNQRPADPLVSRTVDLKTVLEGDVAYVGFTSGTGSDFENVDVLNWTYRQEYKPIGDDGNPPPPPPPPAVPLPAAAWTGLAGLAMLGLVQKRLRRLVGA